MYVYDLTEFFLELEMFQIRLLERIETHLMLTKFISENRVVDEICV
jgi:hypothetical protein